jgi:adenylate cyclase class 2
MLEVEMKFPLPDFAQLERRLHDLGARPGTALTETDHYFNAPNRDFARTDEALRLRCIGASNFVTYKGPRRDAQTKTRTEIEVPLANGERVAEDFIRLLQQLGYRAVAVVRKVRREFWLAREGFTLQICLDEVEEVGRYAELEVLAPEEQLGAARDVLQRLAVELGLDRSERRSYLELLLASRG